MQKILICFSVLMFCSLQVTFAGVISGFEPVWEKYGRPSKIQPNSRALISLKDKLSYSVGVNLGKDFKEQGIDINQALLEQGIVDVQNNGHLRLSEKQVKETIESFQKKRADGSVGKELLDNVSYSIGMNIGRDLKEQSIDINPDLLAAGLEDKLAGKQTLLTEEQMQEAVTVFQKELAEKKQAKAKVEGEKNLKAGEAFLAENAKKDGVVTLPSGLQYKVLTPGKGKKPKADSIVTVNYRGTLVDGKEFDSSYKRNEPSTFPVNGVIPGWTEALQLMQEGAKWQVFIPANLAYGEPGAGSKIGPNATLIFEIDLVKVN